MPNILLVEKNGSIQEKTIKDCSSSDLYKKANLKSGEDFACHTTWKITQKEKTYYVSLYGKLTGRAGQENKYEFPPPVDKLLFFGTCLLLNRKSADSETIENLSAQEWACIYEELYGGFEEIGEEDSEAEAEAEKTDEYNEIPKTKAGYAKDGFVVDDDESEEEEEYVPPPKSAKKPRKKAVSKKAVKVEVEPETLENELICSDELEEEDYV